MSDTRDPGTAGGPGPDQFGAPPEAPDLSRHFQSVVNAALNEFRGAGRVDLVEEVRAEAERAPTTRPVVVIAGESKRGKSSIVNALVRRPELSPTGPDNATSTYVVVTQGETERASVTVAEGGEYRRREIDLADVADWATSEGNPANIRRVVGVEIELDSPLLGSVTLVDTPGVGGLDSVQGAVALPTARQADALVFVLDAGAPLAAPELAFLHDAAARVDAVVVVVGKTDDYPGWQRIVEDDEELLARYAPALAGSPVLPLSARVAEHALAQPPGVLADALLEESGLHALETLLVDRVARRSTALRACNVLVTVRAGLQAIGEPAAVALAVAQGDPALLERLEAEKQRLGDFQKESSEWTHALGAGVQKIKIDHADDLERGIAALQRRYQELIEDLAKKDREELPDRLVADVEALAASLSEQAGLKLADLVTTLMGEVEGDPALGAALARASAAALGDGTMRLEVPKRRELTKVDKLSSIVSFSSGKSIGGIVTSLPVIGGFALPVVGVGLGAGALFSFLMTGSRKEINVQGNLRTWSQQQLSEAQRQIRNDFARRMVDVQEDLRKGMLGYIGRRRNEVTRAIERYDREMQDDRSTGEPVRRTAEQRVAHLRSILGELDRLLFALGGFRVAAPAASARPSGVSHAPPAAVGIAGSATVRRPPAT